MAAYVGDKVTDNDARRLEDFEARLAPGDAAGAALLEEMRTELAKARLGGRALPAKGFARKGLCLGAG